jgi:hypothetical protein
VGAKVPSRNQGLLMPLITSGIHIPQVIPNVNRKNTRIERLFLGGYLSVIIKDIFYRVPTNHLPHF